MTSTSTNYYTTQNKGQGFLLAPPSCPRKRKNPQDCFLSFIDQGTDGYSSSKLIKNEPRKTSDSYFIVKTFKDSVRSYRRNYSHKSVALFRTKRDGSTRSNIAYMTGSFLELDGTTDNSIKSLEDIQTLIAKNNLPQASYVIGTSRGNFHLSWTYDNPLPWTTKNESYWTSQQTRLIQLFQKAGFNVDVGASLNPCQNLRNPSQLHAFNYKRNCRVEIHSTYKKTSLRAIYKALNGTNIPNPTPMKASTKLRRHNRANKTFITTNAELAITLGTCTKTAQRAVARAVKSGDLRIVRRIGNNHGTKRATEYLSNLYIEPQFPEGTLSIFKANSVSQEVLLRDFQANGAEKGHRNKTVFVLAVGLSCESDQTATVTEIADQLREGALRSGLGEREFLRTVKNAVKPVYTNPFSLSKLQDWGLLEPEHSRKSFLH